MVQLEAPEKIYVTEGMLFMTNPEITLQGNSNKIEYTRTDAFIDKACKFLKDKGNEYIAIVDGQLVLRKSMVKHFKEYMKED